VLDLTGIIISVYLIIGYFFSKRYVKFVDTAITEQIEADEVSKEARNVINEADKIISIIGHKNFMIFLHSIFILFWLPIVIVETVKRFL
jgi:hypothetical protein